MKNILLLTFLSACFCGSSFAQTGEGAGPAITFSSTPNGAAGTNFSSKDFIYGSLNLGGKTVKEYFKLPATGESYPYSYLYYIVEVYKGTELVGDNNWTFAYVSPADEKKTSWNFDVLPEPAKASTVLSGTPVFDAGMASAPLYSLIEKRYFKESGTYNIKLRVYNRTLDAYGAEQPYEKWPTAYGSFSFVFNEEDVPTLLQNSEAAAVVAKKKAFK